MRTVNSTDATGIAYYETQRAAAGSGSWTTFDSSSTNPLTAAGLNPGTAYDFRQRGVDPLGNVGSYSETSTASTASDGGSLGQVGSYANLNLSIHPIYSVNMALRDYFLVATQAVPFHVDTQGGIAGTGSQQHNTSGWWDGGAYCRITPPTTDQYERSITIQNLHRSGTLSIQDFNLRFEQRFGPTIASAFQTQNNGCKHALIQYAPTLGGTGGTSSRPVFFIQPTTVSDGPQYRRNNTMAWAPAANTLPAYGDAVYDELFVDQGGTNTSYVNGPQGGYLVDQSDGVTSFLGKPIFRCGDFLTVEYRIISAATAQYPRGLIAMRITSRDGSSFERGIPFDYRNFFAMGQFLDSVTQFGCGQFNVALPTGVNNYFDIGGYFTVARNYNGWLGPRSGFLL